MALFKCSGLGSGSLLRLTYAYDCDEMFQTFTLCMKKIKIFILYLTSIDDNDNISIYNKLFFFSQLHLI